MQNIIVQAIGDVEPFSGEGAIPGIRFRAMRRALGVSAWGMNVIELDPHNEGYPEHDHTEDGQEEVYVVLAGAAVLTVGGESIEVREGQMVRVPPTAKRKFTTTTEPVRLLAIGGTPGKAYAPPPWES